ncbi:Sir2 family NAD-dependent protein deacetylase [Paraburkholderia sp. MM5477-R1]|uniref:Sir2 family NAD-dependent protein deacetylase n=1 Tax=Paraburkholderia sp. MM5477-R1 TaxID=2991062 RepID=UPI003D19FC32
MKYGYFVFTSNVDGAFQKAGYDSDRIMECHGSMHFLQCIDACDGCTWSADGFGPVNRRDLELAGATLLSLASSSTCPRFS